MPPPPPRRVRPAVGVGSVGTRRRQFAFPSTSSPSLPPQLEHLEQLELPLQAHPEYLHDHLLLLEEEWFPLRIKGVEGINDLDSYDLSFSFYYVLFSI
jgi:hypothetical protein